MTIQKVNFYFICYKKEKFCKRAIGKGEKTPTKCLYTSFFEDKSRAETYCKQKLFV